MRRNHWRGACLLILIGLIFQCQNIEWSDQYHIIRHELDLKLDPVLGRIQAKDQIKLAVYAEYTLVELFINQNVRIDSIFVDGNPLKYKVTSKFKLSNYAAGRVDLFLKKNRPLQLLTLRLRNIVNRVNVEIFFHLQLNEIALENSIHIKEIRNQIVVANENKKSVFISDTFWYPSLIHSRACYRVNVLTPVNYEVITSGKLIARQNKTDLWRLTIYEFTEPLEQISLFAGVYQFSAVDVREFTFYTYLFPEHKSYATELLDEATRFTTFYSQIFGEYPYSDFAIVDSPIPIIQAFPGFCVLDSSQIARPRIQETALGKLIFQNWFGQAVFLKPFEGDWTAGLATYMTEHFLQETMAEEKAKDVRYHLLRDYATKVHPDPELILQECWDNTVAEQNILNSTKGAMLFHELRRLVGKDLFLNALKALFQNEKFKFVDWQQLASYFKKNSNRELDRFFDYWLQNDSELQISMMDVQFKKIQRNFTVSATIGTQSESEAASDRIPYQLKMPVRLELSKGMLNQNIEIDSTFTKFQTTSKFNPISLQLDPDFNVFRRLAPEEIQPYIGEVLNGRPKLFVLPGKINYKKLRAYRRQIPHFVQRGEKYKILQDWQVRQHHLQNNFIILFGGIKENRITEKVHDALPPDIEIKPDGFNYNSNGYWKPTHALIAALKNPFNPAYCMLLYWGLGEPAILNSAEEVDNREDDGFVILRDGLQVTWRQYQVIQSPLIHQFELEKTTKPILPKRRSRKK